MMPEHRSDKPQNQHAGLQRRPGIGATENPDCIERFWCVGEGFDDIQIDVGPPSASLELLERLGPSPFERGSFPLIGFLATTYDKVSRDALERSSV